MSERRPWRCTEKSIIIATPYGRIVAFNDRHGYLRVFLQRRIGPYWRFVRAISVLWLVCSKHFDETRGKAPARSGELMVPEGVMSGVQMSVADVCDWLEDFTLRCLSCSLCEEARWETLNCINMCNADWQVAGVSVHPSPPLQDPDCYMEFRRNGAAVACECEPEIHT